MKKHYPLLLALLCTLSSGAWAQWQWVEKDGRKVFSDRAPPIDIPEQNILRRPGGHQRTVAPVVETTPPADEAAATAAPKASKVDPALQARKAQADAAEAAKKKAEDDRAAQSQAENCARAQAAKTTFESGQLLRHTNAKGESVFMDEATRATEQQRIQKVIDTNCKR
ncbi:MULTISPECIES: DUF4124 domain-containing protein [Giesbergeria]|uniref:DUF4124 domain-containing protein n=1 Tax=Giesbergeria sinuosa TaxID=80883 RepID=A0ABV9QB11_9BURK